MKFLIVDRKLGHSGWIHKEGEELRLAATNDGYEAIIVGKGYENDERSIVELSKDADICIITENYWQDWASFDFKDVKIPKFFWAIDYDPTKFYVSQVMIEFIQRNKIDHVFTIDSSLIEYGQYETDVEHSYLPYAASTTQKEIQVEQTNDISFIGSQYPERLNMFPRETEYISNVFGDDYIKAICSSKINLNLSLSNAINGKAFEITGCNGFLLTNKTKDFYELFGDNLIYYYDKNDLYEKCKKYLEDEDLRNHLRRRCGEFVMNNHLYEHRVDEIVRIIERKFNG